MQDRRWFYVRLCAFVVTSGVGSSWLGDVVAARIWGDDISSRWITGFFVGILAIALLIFVWECAAAGLRPPRVLVAAAPALLIAPTGLGWVSDGLQESRWSQALSGVVLLATAGISAWRALEFGRDLNEARGVSTMVVADDDMLRNAKVLVASVGPDGPASTPKALLYTIRKLENLTKIIEVSDQSNDVTGVVSRYFTHDLKVSCAPEICQVRLERNEHGNLLKAGASIRELVGDVAPDLVVVDITGGSKPQTAGLFDIGRNYGYQIIYVVSDVTSNAHWERKLPSATGVDVATRARRFAAKQNLSTLEEPVAKGGVGLTFVSMLAPDRRGSGDLSDTGAEGGDSRE